MYTTTQYSGLQILNLLQKELLNATRSDIRTQVTMDKARVIIVSALHSNYQQLQTNIRRAPKEIST